MKICLLNDTSDCHSGSAKVMENIYLLFSEHEIINECRVLEWDFDWLAINGEGTMHDNAPRAKDILKIAEQAKANGKRVALINTVWQNMGPEFDAIIKDIDVIIAREIYSFKILHKLNDNTVVFPDFCILYPKQGKSTMEPVAMAKSCTHSGAPYKNIFNGFDIPMYSVSRNRKFEDQIENIKSIGIYLTGQHHGVYASLMAGMPFIPTCGNTHKIESLIAWAKVDIPICKTADDVHNAINNIKYIYKEEKKLRDFVLSQRNELEEYIKNNIKE